MIRPAENFRTKSKENKWAWNDLVATNQFQEAVTAALAQMAVNNNSPPDLATAASWHFRMEGAKQFIGILMSLNDSQAKPQPVKGLNYNV